MHGIKVCGECRDCIAYRLKMAKQEQHEDSIKRQKSRLKRMIHE